MHVIILIQQSFHRTKYTNQSLFSIWASPDCFYLLIGLCVPSGMSEWELKINLPMAVAAVCQKGWGWARRACKNMAAHKCEQGPVVRGSVYSCWGVKERLSLSTRSSVMSIYGTMSTSSLRHFIRIHSDWSRFGCWTWIYDGNIL